MLLQWHGYSCLIGFFTAQALATGEEAESTYSSSQLRNQIIQIFYLYRKRNCIPFCRNVTKINCASETEMERLKRKMCPAHSQKPEIPAF